MLRALATAVVLATYAVSFVPQPALVRPRRFVAQRSTDSDAAERVAKLLGKAQTLRDEAAALELEVAPAREAAAAAREAEAAASRPPPLTSPSLRGRTVMVVGANGAVGSLVVRSLLRDTDAACVVAVLKTSSNVPTSMEISKLSYEVGAEEGDGEIRAPWIERNVKMEFNQERQGGYNLDRLVIEPCDCRSFAAVRKALSKHEVDAVVYVKEDAAAAAATSTTAAAGPLLRLRPPRLPSRRRVPTTPARLLLRLLYYCYQTHSPCLSLRYCATGFDGTSARPKVRLPEVFDWSAAVGGFFNGLEARRIFDEALPSPSGDALEDGPADSSGVLVVAKSLAAVEKLKAAAAANDVSAPTRFVLLSAADGAMPEAAVQAKRVGEGALLEAGLSSWAVVRAPRFDDRAEGSGIEVVARGGEDDGEKAAGKLRTAGVARRDLAAWLALRSLTDEELRGHATTVTSKGGAVAYPPAGQI